jgi:hypothetical protein
MAELKTKATAASVDDYFDTIEDTSIRADCQKISELMQKATQAEAKMWGTSIIGFGSYKYTNSTKKTNEWMLTGFSPRKQNITLYIMAGFSAYDELLSKLGKHSCGKSCLYIKRLSDVNIDVLEQLIRASVNHMRQQHS